MTKAEYLEIASQRYDKLRELNKIDNFYDYEVEFVKILKGFGPGTFRKESGHAC